MFEMRQLSCTKLRTSFTGVFCLVSAALTLDLIKNHYVSSTLGQKPKAYGQGFGVSLPTPKDPKESSNSIISNKKGLV